MATGCSLPFMSEPVSSIVSYRCLHQKSAKKNWERYEDRNNVPVHIVDLVVCDDYHFMIAGKILSECA